MRAQIAVSANDNKAVLVDGVNTVVKSPPPDTVTLIDLGVFAVARDIPSELTIAADGAFWGSFGPTVRAGRLDTDLLLTRTILPLSIPANTLLATLRGLPEGADASLGIR